MQYWSGVGGGILEQACPGGKPSSTLTSSWPQASHFNSLGLSVLTCKMGRG